MCSNAFCVHTKWCRLLLPLQYNVTELVVVMSLVPTFVSRNRKKKDSRGNVWMSRAFSVLSIPLFCKSQFYWPEQPIDVAASLPCSLDITPTLSVQTVVQNTSVVLCVVVCRRNSSASRAMCKGFPTKTMTPQVDNNYIYDGTSYVERQQAGSSPRQHFFVRMMLWRGVTQRKCWKRIASTRHTGGRWWPEIHFQSIPSGPWASVIATFSSRS